MKATNKHTTSTQPAHSQRRVRITITTSEQVEKALKALVSVGLSGNTVSEAAERLVCEGLRADLKKRRAELINPETKACQ